MGAPAPQHRVQRLVVELSGVDRADAAALQAAAQRQVQQHLLPLIDRLCTQLGDPTAVQRIHRLEIDLAAWPAAAWADGGDLAPALRARFQTTLESALAQALHTAPTVQADVELVASCLHTGQLPWWADAADRAALQQALARLLAAPHLAGQAWLPPADADAPALQRLVAALGDGDLAGLVARLAPSRPAPAAPWPALLTAIAQALGLAPARLRQAWWREALAAALRPGQPGAASWAQALQQLPSRLGLDAGVLAPAWRRALDQCGTPADAAALAPLWQALDEAWPAGRAPAPAPQARPGDAADAAADEATLLASLATSLALRPPGDAALAWLPWLQALRAQPGGQALPHLGALLASGAPGAAITTALHDALQSVPLPAGAEAHQRPVAAAALAALLQAQALARHSTAHQAPSQQPAPSSPHPAPGLPTADALYLANAGLVLLWPFVQRFADRLGLLQERQFRSPAHAVRLAVLLQCLATGDADPPEFQLPLNKLLCGLPLDASILLNDPITADEQDECLALLDGVLAAAPVLGNISRDGLRQAFLQRAGQVSTQDGHWLLRVERATHDVLIDRLPWSPAIVRLPWMPRLLQVQW